MSIPFDYIGRGMMTGGALIDTYRNSRRERANREIGGLMSSGDYAGAAAKAFGEGDLQTGQAIQQYDQRQQAQQRGQQITGALRTGNYDEALGFASSPEELAQIMQFRNSASEAEKAEAARKAEGIATVAQMVRSLPPEQRLNAAQQYGPQYGIDPAALTPDALSDQALDGYIIRALGLKDYLTYQQRERDASRPIMTPYGIMMPTGSNPAIAQPSEEVLDALPEGAVIRSNPQ